MAIEHLGESAIGPLEAAFRPDMVAASLKAV